MRRLIAGIIISLLTILVGATILIGLTVLLFGGLIFLGLLIASPFIVLHYAKNHKLGPVFGWTALVVVVMTVIGIGILWWRMPPRIHKPDQAVISATDTNPVYDVYWKLKSGEYHKGRNEKYAGARIAYGIPKANGSIWADVPYVEYGSPEAERIRLTKVATPAESPESWEGTWEQDNPEDRGRVTVFNAGPGIYTGSITWTDGKSAFFRLKRTN